LVSIYLGRCGDNMLRNMLVPLHLETQDETAGVLSPCSLQHSRIWSIRSDSTCRFKSPTPPLDTIHGHFSLSHSQFRLKIHLNIITQSLSQSTKSPLNQEMLFFLPWRLRLSGLFPFRIYYETMNVTEPIGFLGGGSARRKVATYTGQKKSLCLELESNPRSQCSSGWRYFLSQTARPLIKKLYN
jgi:hypothetical protein